MKQRSQRGPLTQRYERRYGTGELPMPGGVNTEVDPGSVPPWQFLTVINGNLRGAAVQERGGATVVNTSALHDAAACVYPWDFNPSTPLRCWGCGDGCPGVSNSGKSLVHFDIEQSPLLQRAAWYSLGSDLELGSYGGIPHIGVDSSLRRVQLLQVPYGTENISLAGTTQDLPLETFSGFTVRFLIEFDGLLFVGLDAGAGASKIVSWDGRTVRDDITGIDPPIAAGLWRDSLVVGFAAASNHIRIRERGSSPGTWATVAPGAGTVAAKPGRNSITSYKDKVYIADGGANVWSYDGTTLAIARTVAGTFQNAVVDAFGYLYYGYESAIFDATLGRFDNSTWTDVHKDWSVGPNAISGNSALRALALYKNALVAGITKTGGSSNTYVSLGTDTAGTWDLVDSGAAGFTAPFTRYFVVI